MPLCFGASWSVRAKRMHQSALWASEVQIFWPSMTKKSPSAMALVLREARSEPEPGSLKP